MRMSGPVAASAPRRRQSASARLPCSSDTFSPYGQALICDQIFMPLWVRVLITDTMLPGMTSGEKDLKRFSEVIPSPKRHIRILLCQEEHTLTDELRMSPFSEMLMA